MVEKICVQSDSFMSTLITSQKFAFCQNVSEIGTLDILFSLTLQKSVASITLKGILNRRSGGIDLFRTSLPASKTTREPFSMSNVRFSRPASKVLVTAKKEAALRGCFDKKGNIEAGSDHLLIALVEVETADSRMFLKRLGISDKEVRRATYAYLPD